MTTPNPIWQQAIEAAAKVLDDRREKLADPHSSVAATLRAMAADIRALSPPDTQDGLVELLREAADALLPFAEAFGLANMNDTIGSYFTVAPFAAASQAYTRIDTALSERGSL